MNIKEFSKSFPYTGICDGGQNHNEIVFWLWKFLNVEEKDGKQYLVFRTYEGPELRIPVIPEDHINPETGEPFRHAAGISHELGAALMTSVRILVERVMGNSYAHRSEPGGYYYTENDLEGYRYLNWDKEAEK